MYIGKGKESEEKEIEESQEIDNVDVKDDSEGEDQKPDKASEKDVKEERDRLKDLGVSNTWGVLTSKEKKKQEPEKKTAFRGFK